MNFHLPCPLPIDAAWLPPELRETAIGKRYRVKFCAAEKRSLIKKAYVRPSDWCERHIVLPADAPIPGRWRNRNMPHVAGILDASFHPGVGEIVCCWAPQTVCRLIQEGRLPAVRIGGRALRIPETAFNNYLKNQVVDSDKPIMADR